MSERDPRPRTPSDASIDMDDRRKHERAPSQARVWVRLDTRELTGEAVNLSQGGALFFSHGDLCVTIEFEEQGRRERRSGRLVRAQRMSGDEIGWAVEFDPE